MANLGAVVSDPDLLQQLNQGPQLGPVVDPTTAKFLNQLPDTPAAQQPYTWKILPFSQDTQGNVNFDPNAGFLGALKRAVTAPGQVYSGELPTPYSGGASSQASPEIINRALDFALAFSPTGAALRAGEAIPGAALARSVPSVQQLKGAADTGYAAARASPITVPGEAVANAVQQVKDTLLNEHGIIPESAPKTYAILDKLTTLPSLKPGETVVGTYPGLEAARRGLSGLNAEGGVEGLAAQKAIPELDKFVDTISPDAAAARANMAAAFRSNELTGDLNRANTGILERAEARAHATHSGMNIDNAIRQRVASFLQNPSNLAGYSQSEIDALNNLVRGGAVQNAARRVGNFLGGGGGLGGLATTFAGAALGGHLLPGAEGAALGATIPAAIGVSAKGLETALSKRALRNVDEMVRSRSPLGQALQAQPMPALGLSNAYLRPFALVPSFQPQEQSGFPPYY